MTVSSLGTVAKCREGAGASLFADLHDADLAELGADGWPGLVEVSFGATGGGPVAEEAFAFALDAVANVALEVGGVAVSRAMLAVRLGRRLLRSAWIGHQGSFRHGFDALIL